MDNSGGEQGLETNSENQRKKMDTDQQLESEELSFHGNHNKALEVEHDLYLQMAGLLDIMKCQKDAAHFYRLASQMKVLSNRKIFS